MRRRSIDQRKISSRRPDISERVGISANCFAGSLKKFADEYLKSALTLTVEGDTTATLNISLYDAAYMLRLMVEYAKEGSVIKSHITIKDHFRIETDFFCGLPSVEELSSIALAARSAGFFIEIRGDRIIGRAAFDKKNTLPIYSGNFDKVVEIFEKIFFCK